MPRIARRDRQAIPALTALVIMTVGVAACGSTPPSPASPTASSPFGPSTPSGSTAASNSPAPPVARQLCAKAFEPCDLTPGTYSAAPFDHPFRFTVSDGWTNVWYGVHGGWNELLPYGRWWWASAILYTCNMILPLSLFFQKLRRSPFQADRSSWASKPTHPKRFSGLTLSQPQLITIGGRSATEVDVTVNKDAPEIFSVDQNAFNLGAGEKVRFDLVDMNDQTLVVVLEAVEASQFDKFIDRTKQIYDSITWDPPIPGA